MTTLDELRERLEKAEGPDRELDNDLWRTFHGAIGLQHVTPAHYTASLDAAIALVEAKLPECYRSQEQMNSDGVRFWQARIHLWPNTSYAEHKSEPIALLLALLSALEKESAE